jgi:hypothetical protein
VAAVRGGVMDFGPEDDKVDDDLDFTFSRVRMMAKPKTDIDHSGTDAQHVLAISKVEDGSTTRDGRLEVGKEKQGCLGLSLAQVFRHSWRPINPNWLWVPRSNILSGKGYQARPEEVRRLGQSARRIKRVEPPTPFVRSFSQVVKEGRMAWRREPGGNSWKRSPKDWMEEDDLLDSEFSREEDLRSKLQRAPGGHTEQDQQDMGLHRQGSFTGNKIPRRGGF